MTDYFNPIYNFSTGWRQCLVWKDRSLKLWCRWMHSIALGNYGRRYMVSKQNKSRLSVWITDLKLRSIFAWDGTEVLLDRSILISLSSNPRDTVQTITSSWHAQNIRASQFVVVGISKRKEKGKEQFDMKRGIGNQRKGEDKRKNKYKNKEKVCKFSYRYSRYVGIADFTRPH